LTVPSIRINLDVRVRSESGYEEPFSPEHLVEDLRMRKKAVLSDDQIEEIVGRVVEEIQQSGKREISKTEIGNLVSRKLDEAGY
jgi:transcriptional regulator NrdR family protein